MPSKVWDEITYPLPNLSGEPIEVWEWTSNFIPHFITYVITYSCSIYVNLVHLGKGGPTTEQQKARQRTRTVCMIFGVYCFSM